VALQDLFADPFRIAAGRHVCAGEENLAAARRDRHEAIELHGVACGPWCDDHREADEHHKRLNEALPPSIPTPTREHNDSYRDQDR
jgi:hypothetical protein